MGVYYDSIEINQNFITDFTEAWIFLLAYERKMSNCYFAFLYNINHSTGLSQLCWYPEAQGKQGCSTTKAHCYHPFYSLRKNKLKLICINNETIYGKEE